MGQRQKSTKKLTVQRETLRKLEQRAMSADELRVVAGGWGTCTLHACAPSQLGC